MDILVAVLLLGLSMAAVTGDVSRCPSNLARNSRLRTYGDQCYQFMPYEKHWVPARNDCANRGGHLVVIKNMETQLFLMRTFRELNWQYNGVWIGAHDREQEMNWKWVTGERIEFSYWARSQPSCHLLCFEDCGQMRLDNGGRWHDYKCQGLFSKYSYVCQYDLIPPTTTTTTTTTTESSTSTTTSTTEKSSTLETSLSSSQQPNTTVIDVVVKPLEKHVKLQSANKKHIPREPSTTEVFQVYVQGDSEEHVQRVEPSRQDQLGTGSLVLVVLGILSGVLVGICLGGFIFCRRRRKAVKDELPKVVFENPYYGEVTRPLTEGHEDSDDGERVEIRIYDENAPKNDYDIPPSVAMSNPTYGAPVMLTGTEGAYDIVRTRKVADYDCPPKPLPCNLKKHDDNRVENIYESLENLQNLKAALAEKERNERESCYGEEKNPPEEERYVAMGTVPKHIRET